VASPTGNNTLCYLFLSEKTENTIFLGIVRLAVTMPSPLCRARCRNRLRFEEMHLFVSFVRLVAATADTRVVLSVAVPTLSLEVSRAESAGLLLSGGPGLVQAERRQ